MENIHRTLCTLWISSYRLLKFLVSFLSDAPGVSSMLSLICPAATDAAGITNGASFSVKTDLNGGVASIFHSCKREGEAHSSKRLFSAYKEQHFLLPSFSCYEAHNIKDDKINQHIVQPT